MKQSNFYHYPEQWIDFESVSQTTSQKSIRSIAFDLRIFYLRISGHVSFPSHISSFVIHDMRNCTRLGLRSKSASVSRKMSQCGRKGFWQHSGHSTKQLKFRLKHKPQTIDLFWHLEDTIRPSKYENPRLPHEIIVGTGIYMACLRVLFAFITFAFLVHETKNVPCLFPLHVSQF